MQQNHTEELIQLFGSAYQALASVDLDTKDQELYPASIREITRQRVAAFMTDADDLLARIKHSIEATSYIPTITGEVQA